MTPGNALFLGTEDDKAFLPHLKSMFGGVSTYVLTEPVSLITPLEQYCAKRNVTRIVSTNTAILKQLLSRMGKHIESPALSNYAGSLFELPTCKAEIVFVSPLRQLFTVSYGRFLAARYISKVISPEKWINATDFSWTLVTPANAQEVYDHLAKAIAIAVDIETLKNPLSIRCISYTGIYVSPTGQLSTASYVLPIDSMHAVAWMRRINLLSVPKIFQNGKYDNAYLLRYGAPVVNYLWDTAHQFHSYYSELPKDLAFLNAFFLRKVVYWKDLAETSDLFEYYKYNALDGWATANVLIGWILSAPEWAKRNYTLEFPLVFPCMLSEATGLLRDSARLIAERTATDSLVASKTASLQRSLGAPGFNANSPLQVKSLLKVLGCGDLESTEEKYLKKAAYRHPLNGRIVDVILDIRGLRKLATTYLRTDNDAKQKGIHAGEGGAKEFRGRILYALNPHGTDTARLASGEHPFWCGFNIQNIPRGPEVKRTIRAADGWYLAECDLEQAESRDTGHISGDAALIQAVSGVRDFHSVNASAFFGTPYESIYDDAVGKPKNKKLRDIAKRVNHGANYNMGPAVLVDTMGLPAIFDAAQTLKLPLNDPLEIAEYLLCVFHRTYTKLRGQIRFRSPRVMALLGYTTNPTHKLYAPQTWYASVANEIAVSKMLVSRAYHHTVYNQRHYTASDYIDTGDWTRYCFGDPVTNKLDLNSYVAHPPQSLNARTLNEAYMRVFYDIALPNPDTFRLHAQIHDSILFSYRAGYEHHCDAVQKCMEIPVTVRGADGITRTFTVPAALKVGIIQSDGSLKRAVYWNETE